MKLHPTFVILLCAAAVTVQAAQPGAIYMHHQDTGLARAFCSKRMPVIGGGGFVETPAGMPFKEEKLRQTYPISDATAVLAFGKPAIGCQAASSDFTDTVAAFAICAAPSPAAVLDVEYVSEQTIGAPPACR